ncbi:MAG: amidase [Solirubrobacteraceae bacterium]|nr:amidase [Solirubrobacteraceae bacterium]
MSELEPLLAARAGGDTTAVELVDAALERIDAAQDELCAFRVVRHEAARAEAAEADARRAAGDAAPLLGVPIAVKDDTDVAGETTAFGCAGEFAPAAEDAECVRRLRAAGAVIVGKTTTSELGQWPWTESPSVGLTRNPWHPDHSPGGSSGGSAAAVAAGLVPVALGSDGAGSVRIPAAWTHLVGIKPQRGRVSTWPDADAFNGLTCNGPLARTVLDAALLLDAVRGNHPADRHQPPPPGTPYADVARRAEPGRLRIGLSLRAPFSGAPSKLDPQVRAAIERIAGVLEGLGHTVTGAEPKYGLIGIPFMPRSTVGVRDWVARVPDPSQLDKRTRANARTGLLLKPLLGAARAVEPWLQRRVGSVFDDVDVVLAPTTAQPAPRIGAADGLGEWATDKLMVAAAPYAWPWNVLGWPGVNVPAGLTADGLPVGAQLLGPANTENRLIALAAQLEAVENWHLKRPPGVPAAAFPGAG